MRMGMVMNTKGKNATILCNGGEFVAAKSKPSWKAGDVVWFQEKRQNRMILYAIAACLALLIGIGTFKSNFLIAEVSLVSIDVNPAVEIGINRFDKIVSVKPMDAKGEELLERLDIKNMNYVKAIESIVTNEYMKLFIDKEKSVTFAVNTNNADRENEIMDYLKSTVNTAISSHHSSVEIEYYTVDGELVKSAHAHGVTPGKYMVLLQLKNAYNDVNINEYLHHSIGEIKKEISECQNEHVNGHEHGEEKDDENHSHSH